MQWDTALVKSRGLRDVSLQAIAGISSFIPFRTHRNNSDSIFCGTSYFLVNKNLLGLLERVQHNVIIIYVILSRWRYTSESFILLNMFAKSILLFFCRSAVEHLSRSVRALSRSALYYYTNGFRTATRPAPAPARDRCLITTSSPTLVNTYKAIFPTGNYTLLSKTVQEDDPATGKGTI